MTDLSPIGFGASRIGSFNNPQPVSASIALIRAALDLGVTVIDTSNIYGQGDSERAIGTALAGGKRKQAFIITKGGRRFSTKARALAWLKPAIRPILAARGQGDQVSARRGEVLGTDWTPASLNASIEGSLRRLRSDVVDGFLLHSPPAQVAADPAIGATLGALRTAGKARYVGVSCDDADTLAAAIAMPECTMLQLPLTLLPEARVHADEIRRRGIVILMREVIRMSPETRPEAAVRACLADPLVKTVLVGTTRLAHLAEIAEACR